jgi:HAD superfamily hydrolase (TIGR01509 family)
MGRLTAADLDAVTIDAYGTLVTLRRDPADALRQALRERGVERTRDEVAAAFAVEARYYRERSHEGADEASLALLRRDCAAVFLDALGADLDPGEFAPAYVASLEFEPVPGAVEAVLALERLGLRLAVVSNWDVALREYLEELGLAEHFAAVVTSAEAGAPKPDPRIFELALERVGVRPERALHVGDSEADEEGARAAGMSFAPTPLADVPARLA